MPFGLKQETVTKINSVFERYPDVEKAILYGSRAKGNFKNGSDIDLTLHGRELNLELINTIRLAIDDLMLPYTIDLSIYSQIQNPELIEHIQRVGSVFYAKREA